jgi:hypothetical protein
MTDQERSIFVKNEYRYSIAQNTLVVARNPQADELTIVSNLNENDAELMAEKLLAVHDNPRFFEIEIEGILDITSFIGGPVSYILDFPAFETDGRTMTVVGFKADFNTGKTTISVRG